MGYKTCFTIVVPFLLFLQPKQTAVPANVDGNLKPLPGSIADIPLPAGYYRKLYDSSSFACWLRQVGLKKDKTVYLYNGQPKANQLAQFAVLNISTGNKNLQQCADAVIRLRAEYLFAQKRFNEIVFTDNAGVKYDFTLPYQHANLLAYLEKVFGRCGTASLSKQLKKTGWAELQPGDVLIRGGFPGHAAIVMDVAVSKEGKSIYLLAQSYMPAQDIHILVNPAKLAISPWYEVNEALTIETPEYVFSRTELKTW
jgi:hypothetical protein